MKKLSTVFLLSFDPFEVSFYRSLNNFGTVESGQMREVLRSD